MQPPSGTSCTMSIRATEFTPGLLRTPNLFRYWFYPQCKDKALISFTS